VTAGATVEELMARLQRVEDELAIQRLILGYGPAADAGLAQLAASRWSADGVYDWDAGGAPFEGRLAVETMLLTDTHQNLIKEGAAHFAGPVMVELDGDAATALNYSLVVRHEAGRFYLWRTSAVRWELERTADGWKATRRTNRLLDDTAGGLELFKGALAEETSS
jgi:hypothetical protein